MFFSNLRDYVLRPNDRRIRDDRVSLAVAFAFSIMMLLLGQPERSAGIAGVLVLGACMLGFTVKYCQSPFRASLKRRSGTAPLDSFLYRPVTRRLAWLSVGMMVSIFSAPLIEAAILGRRMRNLLSSTPLNRDAIKKITETFGEANRYGVAIPPRTVRDVQAALRKTSEETPELSAEAINAAAAGAMTVNLDLPPDLHGPVFETLPEAKDSMGSFEAIATNTAPDSYSTIGVTREPDVAKMNRIDSPLPVLSQYGPAFWVVKGLTATLDGWHMKHVVFWNMNLVYSGGPLELEGVYFLGCQLQTIPSDNSWQLISGVIYGGWVTVSLR